MFKKICILFLSMIFLISCGKVTEQEARQVLQNHLQTRYGEPFEIGFMGRRSSREDRVWYEADIMPTRYKGTSKEYDKYYRSVGTVRIYSNFLGMEKLGTGGDVYFGVRLNESTGEFYRPKLEEIFGKQVLPIFQIDA